MKGHRGGGRIPAAEWLLSGLICVLALVSVPAGAQHSPVRLSETFTSARKALSGPETLRMPAAAHYDVVALMVEFQPDSSRFTTGDGTFGGVLFEETDPPLIDPLPHHGGYFDAHLSFLENYIARASDGRTAVSTHLLPKVIRVSGRMGDYSPIGFDAGSDAELVKLAALVREAWSLADQDPAIHLPTGLDPDHTAYIIFHAGVGRDLELLGTTLDKTPEDLPSLFFDSDAFSRLLGQSGFSLDGSPVGNTLLIPRTETRRGFDFFQDKQFLAEFSINGMLVASFLNYLGVPDLFDTETGRSAIGPFGVMDGLGIFAFSGLFPPEPSAWTKLYVGWADIQEAGSRTDLAVQLRHTGDTSANDVFLAPIAEGEFFLVENRHRDPEGDGVNLRVWNDGVVSTVHFDNGDDGFNSATTKGFPGGVVIDMDNFDFALPGGKDEDGNLLNGGVLIWHIDERRLLEELPTNAVNANPSRRAVDLEEADGAQDLGFPSQSFFGPSFDVGSPFDFFYEGNPTTVITSTGQEIRLYENRFGSDTIPNSRTVDRGESFIEISSFSLPGPEMQFEYRIADGDGIRFRDDLSCLMTHWDLSSYAGGALRYIGTETIDLMVFTEEPDGQGVLMMRQRYSNGCGRQIVTALLPAVPVQVGDRIVAVDPVGFLEADGRGPVERLASFPEDQQLVRTTTPLVRLDDGSVYVGAETAVGPVLASLVNGVARTRSSLPVRSLAVIDGSDLVIVYNDHASLKTGQMTWSFEPLFDEQSIQAVFGRDEKGLIGAIPDVAASHVNILLEDGSVRRVFVGGGLSGEMNTNPVLADLDRDGYLDILISAGNTLQAFGRSGAVTAGFPLALRAPATSQPLVAELSDSGAWTIVVAAGDGRIDAYDLGHGGRQIEGFPVSSGAQASIAPVIFEDKLAAISSSRDLRVWELDMIGRSAWSEAPGAGNRSFISIAGDEPGPETHDRLLVGSETYNWPNPIRNGQTWIRFMTSEDSDIQIKILDLAGNLIDRFDETGITGGISSEVRWLTTAGSGIYLARVQATSVSGQTETRLIKMAIIR